jgi:chromosome segregation protein
LRIRALEITGFKSFADRVIFALDSGISAIVGPNGCGKSNVVDAIRWVMGEQNPRHLRGQVMHDVIFGGTERRAPIGMAEVVLHLDNSDGRAPEAYAGFSEIQVARRLYGSGESEYLINKIPVRLRDIMDFFLDTGVGTRGYTIVEQGHIATIVSTKPEERRIIIEEAAGIGKYRQRRRETERKLEATERNLVRVNDILGELRRQLASLDRQARKAARYKELSAQLRDLELLSSAAALERHDAKLAEIDRSLGELRAQGVSLDAAVARAESRLETERRAHLDREKELQSGRERLFSLRSEIQSLESRIEYERRERESLLGLAEEREGEIVELEQQLANHRTAHTEVLEELGTAEERLGREEADLEQRAQVLHERSEQLAALRGRREALQARLVDLSTEAATLDGRAHSLVERRRELETRLRQQDEALEATSLERDVSHREEEVLETRHREALAEQDQFGLQLVELLRAHTDGSSRLARVRADLASVRERLQHAEARLESLREAERSSAAANREALERLSESEQRLILGRLSDVVQVQDGFERALEAVLGSRLEAALVGNPEAALALLERLRADESARATLLAPGAEDDSASSGFVPLGVSLLSKVSIATRFEGVLRRLLGDVYVVDDLREAVKRYGVSRPPAVFVTRGGELLDRSGALTGGAAPPQGSLSRSSEIRRLTEQIEALSAERSRCEALEVEESQRLESLGRETENTRSRRHTAELAVLHYEKDLERMRERGKAAEESLESQRASKEHMTGELERVTAEAERGAARLAEISRERLQIQSELERVVGDVSGLAAEVQQLEQRVTQQRVELAEVRAKRDQLRAARDRLRASVDEGREWIARRREEVRSARERAESLARSTSEASLLVAERIEQEESVRVAQESVQGVYDQASRVVEEAEAEARRGQAEREEIRSKLQACELSKQEVELRRDQLLERVREKYQLELDRFEPPADVRELDPEAREAELRRLKQSLDSLGDVHLGAIEEHEEVSERFRYLTEQKEDLDVSIERLRNAIARINRTSRARFRETFEAVDAEFQKLFPRLFRGGRAHLSLTESDDVLEAGIEISAQPPGKKLQSVNLLSGGEKSLTAIALLFAVFSVKPSPFFLLDEVDAALDDANVHRFNELVESMADRSQFILITHNKGTIEIARTLYGVTMAERGVSKLVTVDLVS